MNKFFTAATLALGLSFASAVSAQEATADNGASVGNDWHIGIGPSYRSFKKATFKFRNTGSSQFAFLGSNPDAIGKVADIKANASNKYLDTLTIVDAHGGKGKARGSYDFLEKVGPIVNLGYVISANDSLVISLEANLQYFNMDSSCGYKNVSGEEIANTYILVYGSSSPRETSTYESDFLTAKSKVKASMELWVLDFGASVAYEFENGLGVKVAAGPSLNWSFMDTTCSTHNGTGKATRKNSEKDDVNFGLYVSAGAYYWFTERFGISADLRYDEVFSKPSTKYFEQDLSGFGGNAKFMVRF